MLMYYFLLFFVFFCLFFNLLFLDDHTRVKLRETANAFHSDYINASFIVSKNIFCFGLHLACCMLAIYFDENVHNLHRMNP